MFLLKKEHVLKLLDNLLYFSLLGLGIYFIYIGDVIPRFWIGRTNFAEYEEAMNELPTISTFIIDDIPANFTLGKDFNLSLSGKILEFGINDIQSRNLTVDVQPVMPEQFFSPSGKKLHWVQIRPLNFPPEVPHRLDLEYSFVSTPQSRVGIYLTPENTSFECMYSNFDAEKLTFMANMGESIALKLQPKKILYLAKGCRKMPFIEAVVQNVEVDASSYHGKLCRATRIFGYCAALTKSELVKNLKICTNDSDEEKLKNILIQVLEKIEKQPCTALKYEVRKQGPYPHHQNRVKLGIRLKNPYKTMVREEYIIYDMAATIGAIGGTLGLCIGFSFMDWVKDIGIFFLKVLLRIHSQTCQNKMICGEDAVEKTKVFEFNTPTLPDQPDLTLLAFRLNNKVAEMQRQLNELREEIRMSLPIKRSINQ